MVILCDFDETTAVENLATLLLARFGTGPMGTSGQTWQELHDQLHHGKITLKECQELCFAALHTNEADQIVFVQENALMRPGFTELAVFCAERGVLLAVLSHGLTFYVRALLSKHGLGHLPVYAVETETSITGTAFTYRFMREECQTPWHCKCNVVDLYRAQGHAVFYVGDGYTDACPARKADFIFARQPLLDICEREGMAHQELGDFHSIVTYLREREQRASQSSERLRHD